MKECIPTITPIILDEMHDQSSALAFGVRVAIRHKFTRAEIFITYKYCFFAFWETHNGDIHLYLIWSHERNTNMSVHLLYVFRPRFVCGAVPFGSFAHSNIYMLVLAVSLFMCCVVRPAFSKFHHQRQNANVGAHNRRDRKAKMNGVQYTAAAKAQAHTQCEKGQKRNLVIPRPYQTWLFINILIWFIYGYDYLYMGNIHIYAVTHIYIYTYKGHEGVSVDAELPEKTTRDPYHHVEYIPDIFSHPNQSIFKMQYFCSTSQHRNGSQERAESLLLCQFVFDRFSLSRKLKKCCHWIVL